MNGHLGKLVLVVALSHANRLVGRTVGPRWAGLITALPCSTAIALVGSGSDRGVNYAVVMADGCWVGLAGASAVPMAFAAAIGAGWGPARGVALAVAAYFAVMAGVATLAGWIGGNLPAAVLALGAATFLAVRMIEPIAPAPARRFVLSPRHVFWLRTVVPALCLSGAMGLGERLGPGAAGSLGTFPGVTLTALLLTNLEAGPVAAVRMARALPPGNWAMVAFLAAFIRTAPTLGLGAGTAVGYAAALTCLGLVAHLTNPLALAQIRRRLAADRRQLATMPGPKLEPSPCPGTSWPRHPRRFSPFVESIAA